MTVCAGGPAVRVERPRAAGVGPAARAGPVLPAPRAGLYPSRAQNTQYRIQN